MSHFKLVSSTKASNVIPVTKYVSEKTGLTVVIGAVEGPIVNGFFGLATEAHDDDGLPHTLEHLIFLGSERYPYKGILDLLANRCMAQGTNAWTDTDHTCYTIETAGDAGMLSLMPVYLDHILHPTLSDEGFITEVHHIDGEGEDAGVVYCEMQGRENSAGSRCELRLSRAMYPNSGYSSETGGIMENLRTSTDNTKVRNFHKKFYRSENLTIVLTGQIKAEDVFKALETVENDILAKRESQTQEEWVQPWRTVPPPPQYGEYPVQWPADTEDCGQILFGWRGPNLSSPNALKELSAVSILLRYFCDTASAPLQKRLVEREDALAGDVSYNLTENLVTCIKIEINNVPVDKLQEAKQEAKQCIHAVRSGTEPLDMERMKTLVQKTLRESLAALESDPHHSIAFMILGDVLYSFSDNDFVSRMNPQIVLEELLREPASYWLGLIQKYIIDEMVTVIGSPSIELQTKMAKEDLDRIAEQRKKLGEAGLAQKVKQLEDAMKFNERPPPAGTLASVPVPACDFKRHTVSTWSTDGEPCPYFDLKEIPLYTRAHSLATNFVYINLIFDTRNVDEKTRKWIPLLLNGLAECPVWRGNTLIPHEQVISENEQLTVSFGNTVGLSSGGNFSCGSFGNFLRISVTCEPKDYNAVVNHLYETLYAAEINKERLLVFAQRLINEVSQTRRNGNKMCSALVRDAVYAKNSNVHWNSVLRQHKFLKELIEQLNAGGDSVQNAVDSANAAMRYMTEKPWLHIAANFEKFSLSTANWKMFERNNEIVPADCPCNNTARPTLYKDAELLSGWGGGFVAGCGGVESNFLTLLSPGPLGYKIEDIAPVMLALNYFTQLEGPMWRLIRGSGLSYSYGVRPSQHEGKLIFSLYRATNVVAAYTKAKQIIEEYLSSGQFDTELFESAKSTAIFEVVAQEKGPTDMARQSLLNFVKGVSDSYNTELACALALVTSADAHEAARKWLPTLFDLSQGKLSIVCHPSKVNDIKTAFDKINVQLDAFESLEASHINN